MKKGFLWLGLSLLMVTSVVLSSCGTKVTTTTTTTTSTNTATATTTTTKSTTVTTSSTQSTTTTTPTAAGAPQYGGTLVTFGYRSSQAPGGWDVCNVPFASDAYFFPYAEFLLTGDIAGKGPRGTNDFSFQIAEGIPLSDLTGQLAESWEQSDLLTLVFHIRHGVMWTGNASIGMAPREFTANDAAFQLNRYWQSPYGGTASYFASAIATDKYTLTVKMKSYSPDWAYRIGYAFKCEMQPQEVVTAGPQNWKNQTGTGPFILTDYVDGSEATYTRNTSYWGTTTINGKSYQLPFIQTLKYPIISDLSTEIAAIRTQKIDIAWQIPATQKASLTSTSPNLKTYDYLTNSVLCVGFNMANTIFKNLNVRRALMIGTDLNTIAKSVYPGAAEVNAFPLARGLPAYTAISDMPASTKLLFTYDPTTAKKMLADAGYPNGFSCQLVIQTNSTYNDIASLLVSQWAKLGVTVTIKSDDVATWSGVMVGHGYPDLFMSSTGNGSAATQLGPNKVLQGAANTANWNDSHALDLLNQALATSDDTAQTAIFKELNLYIIDQCPWIGFAAGPVFGAYYPWVKNFYNEIEGGDYDYVPIINQIWIDPSLKK